ncbi:hypothetical protein [Sulfitobacter sp. CW3]|uniref:hypothetical protein n=1 Tax=Sulfitobacter sp. CW3 TaxID=2861965 RepID=UPI001C5FC3A5|nr:hypothetical protein [Sulfitobacter sp. CW3]MBW4961488.1 hypothetical protein [Sulfitobacter sp. CW3]
MFEELVIADPEEVSSEISQLKLDLEKLIEVVRYADSEGALCTRNDPKGHRLITVNAKAARGLREQFCGDEWVHDESGNQPGILNESLGLRIIPCNFDENAGNPLLTPTNWTEKGTASGRKVRCNGTGWLPGLESPVIEGEDEIVTLVLGIYSQDGEQLSAELSYPIEFSGKKYTKFSKRMMILNSDSDIGSPIDDSDMGGPTEIVEIDVKRK